MPQFRMHVMHSMQTGYKLSYSSSTTKEKETYYTKGLLNSRQFEMVRKISWYAIDSEE